MLENKHKPGNSGISLADGGGGSCSGHPTNRPSLTTGTALDSSYKIGLEKKLENGKRENI
ncbi:hypothetical protein TYRP_021072 [Tyrophagus putrescentiae]|nr:hypothetical protein TYRP_021072 [Tyrophagus putrescentiae]